MATQETFITDALSGVLELAEPQRMQRKITAIDLTMLEGRVIAPDAKKSKYNTENSKDKAASEIKDSLGSLDILPTELVIIVIRAMELERWLKE